MSYKTILTIHFPCQNDPCPRSLQCMLNFCKALVSPKGHFPCQDDPHPQNLELESRRTVGHPDRSLDVQDTCLHIIIFSLLLKNDSIFKISDQLESGFMSSFYISPVDIIYIINSNKPQCPCPINWRLHILYIYFYYCFSHFFGAVDILNVSINENVLIFCTHYK